VTASIAGSEVTIDGQPAGPSPVSKELPAGDHEIAVASPGHGHETRTVALHEGAPVALDIPLCDLVALSVTPADASVTVDGGPARRDDGQLCLPPGEHSVTAHAEGFHDATSVIPAERPPSAELALTPVGALLSVRGAPAGALLSIDGRVQGPLPLADPLELPPGEHHFEITHAGMLPFRGHANLRGNEPALVSLTHVRRPGHPKAWIFAGVSAAAAATGVVLGVLALGKAGDHDDRAAEAGVTAGDARLDDLETSSRRLALGGDIAFLAAVLTAGTSTYFFLREGHGLSEGSIKVGAGVTAGGVSLFTTRRF
jgi:PEGA domain